MNKEELMLKFQPLFHIMNKKIQLLNDMYTITVKQNAIVKEVEIDEDQLADQISQGQRCMDQMDELDKNFEKMYDAFQENSEKQQFHFLVDQVQGYKDQMKDILIEIDAVQKDNTLYLQKQMDDAKQKVNETRSKRQAMRKRQRMVGNYYNNARAEYNGQSFFIDKKN